MRKAVGFIKKDLQLKTIDKQNGWIYKYPSLKIRIQHFFNK
jgi:hypothetical protein